VLLFPIVAVGCVACLLTACACECPRVCMFGCARVCARARHHVCCVYARTHARCVRACVWGWVGGCILFVQQRRGVLRLHGPPPFRAEGTSPSADDRCVRFIRTSLSVCDRCDDCVASRLKSSAASTHHGASVAQASQPRLCSARAWKRSSSCATT
jgi:hypothetical protein